MKRRTGALAVVRAICAVVCALVAAGAGPAGPVIRSAAAAVTVNGDAHAWHDVLAAYRKLSHLRGYRIKMDGSAGSMIVEVVPRRNAMHSTAQSQGLGAEVIVVGNQSRSRLSAPGTPAEWRCQGIPPLPKASDFLDAQGTVDITRGRDTTIDGEPVRVYRVAASGSAALGEIQSTLFVGAESGLPRRAVMMTAVGEQTLDYYDYGAPIEITLPPCGNS